MSVAILATVHVSIGHDDDLVIAELREVQRHAVLFGADGHAESRVDVADLFALEDLVLHRLLHVEDSYHAAGGSLGTRGHDLA